MFSKYLLLANNNLFFKINSHKILNLATKICPKKKFQSPKSPTLNKNQKSLHTKSDFPNSKRETKRTKRKRDCNIQYWISRGNRIAIKIDRNWVICGQFWVAKDRPFRSKKTANIWCRFAPCENSIAGSFLFALSNLIWLFWGNKKRIKEENVRQQRKGMQHSGWWWWNFWIEGNWREKGE